MYRNPFIILSVDASYSNMYVGFLNPKSLVDRLPNKDSAQADSAQLMGQPKSLNNRPEGRSNHQLKGLAEEERHPPSDSGPPLRPEHSLRSPTRLWTASSTGRPVQNTTSDSDPRLRPGIRQSPAHCSSLTGTTRADWDQPTGDARSIKTRKRPEKVRQGLQSQTTLPGSYLVQLQKQYSAASLTQIVL